MIDPDGRAAFLATYPVPRETLAKLDRFAELIMEQSQAQNLIAASTMSAFWHRHMLDSAQLSPIAGTGNREWLDVGSGAGFPGIVLAILSDDRHLLVEPRRLRAEFLTSVVRDLGLDHRVSIQQIQIERVVHSAFDIITARAFSSLAKTIEATIHLADRKTQWLLHKGQRATAEVAEALQIWEGAVELIPSMTDPRASIAKLSQIRRKALR